MSKNIITAIVRVACNNPDLLTHNRILEFADRVKEAFDALEAAQPAPAATGEERAAGDSVPIVMTNFYQNPAATLLAGVIDELTDLHRTVQVGPPFDQAGIAAQLHTISVNGEAAWLYLQLLVESSSCAGNA